MVGTWKRVGLSVLTVWLTLSGQAAAEMFWGLTTDHTLVRFSSDAPGTPNVTLPITGLPAGEQIVAIEVLLFDGRFLGVSNAGRLYSIDRQTGAATVLFVAEPVFAPTGTAFGVTAVGLSLQLISNTGSRTFVNYNDGLQQPDQPLTPSRHLVALATVPNSGLLVALDSNTDEIYRFNLNGTITPVGSLNVDTSEVAGMDATFAAFPGNETLYAALTVNGAPALYTVSPNTGNATLIAAIGSAPITALTMDHQALVLEPSALPFSVTESNTQLTFSVRRTGDTAVPAEFLVSTTLPEYGAQATPGADFVPKSELLNFAAGEMQKNISVSILDDTLRESSESFLLTITETATSKVASVGGVNITDDENQPPVLTVTTPISHPLDLLAPTPFTLTGTVTDDEPGVKVEYFSAYINPYGPAGTSLSNPWTFENIPLRVGRSYIHVVAEDVWGARTSYEYEIWVSAQSEQTFVFAEGATGNFMSTDLLFGNPHAVDIPITIDFLRDDGTVVPQALTLPAAQRTTLAVDTIPGLEANATAAVVRTSSHPIVVERTMRWDESGYGAHTEKAASGLSQTWYFAEGSQGFFSTYLLLVNPHATNNEVTVRFLREQAPPVTKTYTVGPLTRLTIYAGDIPDLVEQSFGIEVTFAQPGVAERAMYFGLDPLWTGGHESVGATAPAHLWYLAEGATGPFFDTYVLVANPSNQPADVTFTFLLDNGAPVTRKKQVPPNSRLTVNIEEEDPSLANVAVATRVLSPQPIVVERAQYWPGTSEQWYEAHNSFGVTMPDMHWGLAEGRVGGPEGYETYILLANPEQSDVHVTMRFTQQNGPPVIKEFIVPARRRFNVAVGGAEVPEITEGTFSVDIRSTWFLVVERAMYANSNGQIWGLGTNATATPLP